MPADHIPEGTQVQTRLPNGHYLKLQAGHNDRVATDLHEQGFEGHEAETVERFLRLAVDADVIFDVGAHTGVFAIAAALTNPGARIFAFEPVPKVFALLERNIELNGVTNVLSMQIALSDADGPIELYIPPSGTPTSASTLKGFRANARPTEVRGTRGDTLARELGLDGIDLMKIDTEATEPRVLAGLTETIRRSQPAIICEVLAGRTEAALNGLLPKLGYEAWHLTEAGPVAKPEVVGDPTYRSPNYLFLPAGREPA